MEEAMGVILNKLIHQIQRKLSNISKVSSNLAVMKYLFLFFGPSGCGKSTMAQHIVKENSSYVFLEGDKYHSASNKAKMANSKPLDDSDRQGWLADLSSAPLTHFKSGAPVVIIACSALRVRYRNVFRVAVVEANKAINDTDSKIDLRFVFLKMDEEKVTGLVDKRKSEGHFMPPDLVKSQFETLEAPGQDELDKDCVEVDANQSVSKVQECSYAVVRSHIRD